MLSFLNRARVVVVFALVGLGAVSARVSALQPPRPGELAEAAKRGELDSRRARALKLGNHRTDPRLVWSLKRQQMRAAGATEAEIAATIGNAPPLGWQGGLPATGTPKTFVLLVDFSDYPRGANHDRADVESKFFGDGLSGDAPYESLRNYYQRASYQALKIQGTVFDWYRAQNPRSYYKNLGDGPGQEVLMKEVLNYWDAQGHDFTQYDNDNNGTLDSLFIKWTGPDEGWSSFWWAYQWVWHTDLDYRIDGKEVGKYVWSWVANVGYDGRADYFPRTDIHETGHLLGLPDLYDYNGSIGPDGGVGDLDMMHANWGDHNCFSKYMLGWLAPTVIGSGSQTKDLGPSGTTKDCVLIMPGATSSTLFGEFFMAQYRKRSTGNDPANYPTDGLVVWHVDSTLNSDGDDFEYDNSFTEHKYVRLMEADGLEEIEQNGQADEGDFYLLPKWLGTTTVPDSRRYSGQVTGVTIDQLGSPGATMSGRFRINTGPEIVLSGSTLTAESCPMQNNAIDPFETVTVSIQLRNLGLGASSGLTATLLATGGVTAPSGPQTYGILQANGGTASKPFTFTSEGTCGGTITLSLQLNNGGTDLGIVSVSYVLGAYLIGYSESFDAVTAPALPAGWTATASGAVSKWATRTTSAHTSPNSVFSAAPSTVSDNRLESPPVSITTATARLKFRHKYDIEELFDGGVLEIRVGGGDFQDILEAGGSFASGGYVWTIPSGWDNPLVGRKAWSGQLSNYASVVVNLPPSLAGQTVRFRWRIGTDSMIGKTGWYVDTIELEDGFGCCDPLAIVVDRTSVTVPEASTATFQVRLASAPVGDKVVTISKLPGGDADLTIQSGANLMFTASNYDVYQTVTLAAADDPDAVNGQATFVCQAPDLHDAIVVATEEDDNSYDFRVVPEAVTVPESGTAGFQLKLGAMPLAPLVVSVAWLSGDPDITVQSGSSLTFDDQNWDTYQTVTLAAAEDPDAADQQAVIRVSSPGWPDLLVNAVEDDNDILAIEPDATSVPVPENGLGTFKVRLTAAPISPLTILVQRQSGDESIKVESGSSLVFTEQNYNVWQTVTLAALNDADYVNGSAVIRCSGIGVEDKYLDALEVDDDVMEMVMTTASVLVPEGYTAGFPIKLGAQPLEDIVVAVTISGDPDLTLLTGGAVKFTPSNWNVFQTVTIEAAQDDDIEAGQAIVRCSAPGMPLKTLTAIEADDDALAIVPSSLSVTVGEMQTATFAVRLSAKPDGNVTVDVATAPGDPDITVASAGQLLFTPTGPGAWNVPQPVIVAAARDLDTLNGQSKVRLSGPGLTSVDVTVNEADDGIDPPMWYEDADNDGVGNAARGMPAWTQPVGYVADALDCNDADPDVHPGAAEACDNSVDDNCDGQVNEGCPPPDTDGDGVEDAADQCPNTPAGATVQANGCPPPPPADNDADDDGVLDGADQCPNTPAGTTVDANGCPPPPPADNDADDDGVLDDVDQCPNTPVGTTVGTNGCPPPPVDDDADDDGVLDGADECPNTPAGTNVGADGCAVNQDPNDDDDDGEPAGQDTPDDLDDDSPSPLPLCGAGLAETAIGLLLCLTLVQTRRRSMSV